MKALVSLGLTPPLLCLQGYVLTQLWAWFLVPAFSLPQIGLATAIGVCGCFAVARGMRFFKTDFTLFEVFQYALAEAMFMAMWLLAGIVAVQFLPEIPA